jgi:DNA-binding NarL/FixJ family response regulator
MKKKVLVAEPREVIRTGLCRVFQQEPDVSEVSSVATRDELQQHLSFPDLDFVVVSQILITDIQSLPQGRFALLVDEPDLNDLMCAYEHQARGYFSINITAGLLKAALSSGRDTFLVDQALLPWMMDLITKLSRRADELDLLSPREREVAILLDEGLDRRTVARQLHILEATLKTHLKNIAHKQEDAHWSQEVLSYRRHLKRS